MADEKTVHVCRYCKQDHYTIHSRTDRTATGYIQNFWTIPLCRAAILANVPSPEAGAGDDEGDGKP